MLECSYAPGAHLGRMEHPGATQLLYQSLPRAARKQPIVTSWCSTCASTLCYEAALDFDSACHAASTSASRSGRSPARHSWSGGRVASHVSVSRTVSMSGR